MKRVIWFILLAAALRMSGLLPFESHDVAQLVPVEALVVSLDGDMVVLDGGDAQGRGGDWQAALADLEQSADGAVFLSTAGQLVLVGRAVKLLPEIVDSGRIRPAAAVCYAAAAPDPEDAADYLSAHECQVTVQRLQAAALRGETVTLPWLMETEGGLRLYG